MPSILIADDEVIQCMLLEEQLIACGHEVATVHSGEAAVRLAMQTKPDFTLMDILMPGSLNGIDAAKIILSKLTVPSFLSRVVKIIPRWIMPVSVSPQAFYTSRCQSPNFMP